MIIPGVKNLKYFDPYDDHIIETPDAWIINNKKICRPLRNETVICKRNSKLYTGLGKRFCCADMKNLWKRKRKNKENKIRWQFFSLPFTLPYWTTWSIFLDDILIMIHVKSIKNLNLTQFNLVLFHFGNKDISEICTIKLCESETVDAYPTACYLLPFQNNVHVILNIRGKKEVSYFNIMFGHIEQNT
jgi:hypothetical protein